MDLNFIKNIFTENTAPNYLLAFGILTGGIVISYFFRILILKRLRKLSKTTETKADDYFVKVLGKTLMPLLFFGSFWIATRFLILGEKAVKAMQIFGMIIVTLVSIYFFISTVTYILELYWRKRKQDEAKARSIKGALVIIRFIIWSFSIIFLLDNLGFKISTVIAGLGIGGVAIALAAQAILGDLFSYFAIFLDRPFEVGDFIIIDNYLGTVEYIGIKTTRIRSLGGEQLIMSNTDLTNSRLRNYRRMEKRRVVFRIGVTYQTGLEQLKMIPNLAQSVIDGIPDTVFDRTHFAEYGAYSLDFEIVYYVCGNEYNKYMDIHQQINLKIFEEFKKNGIEFAYPTQTLFMEKS